MRVLLVEDDEDKARDVSDFINDRYVVDEIVFARSLQSGLRAVLAGDGDLVLLDMTMRNFDRSLEEDGGRPHPFAGREILRQMKREEVSIPVIVVTHFERFGEEAEEVTLSDLKEELRQRFPDYIGTVQFRSNVDEWKTQLASMIGDRLPRRD